MVFGNPIIKSGCALSVTDSLASTKRPRMIVYWLLKADLLGGADVR